MFAARRAGPVVACLFLMSVGLLAAGGTASAAETHPASTVQAAACNAVGVVYEAQVNKNVTFCGLGFYYKPSGGWTVALVTPSTHNRWWFHQNADNTGWSWCTDYTHANGFGIVPIPAARQHPGNIQVSANTATC
jgi:putative alpha-1,2-mannosidase